jgi:hypothetical protein
MVVPLWLRCSWQLMLVARLLGVVARLLPVACLLPAA